MDMDVYVNYRGAWAEFTIDGNGTSGSGTESFEFPVTYNQDTGNTIRYVKIQFSYPKQDDDWAEGTCIPSSICANKLDAYVYNGSDSDSDTEEVANRLTSTMNREQQGIAMMKIDASNFD